MLLQNKYQAITKSVIGCAMEVHRTPGCGSQKVICQRSLAAEMEKAGWVFGRETEMPLFYKGVDVGSRRVDFLVADAVLVELKALHEITPTHHAQIINFGERGLRSKRFIKAPRSLRPIS